MSETYPDDEKEHKAPLWFRMLPKPVQYYLFLRELEKLLKDTETPKRIHITAQEMERAVRILQGKESEGGRE